MNKNQTKGANLGRRLLSLCVVFALALSLLSISAAAAWDYELTGNEAHYGGMTVTVTYNNGEETVDCEIVSVTGGETIYVRGGDLILLSVPEHGYQWEDIHVKNFEIEQNVESGRVATPYIYAKKSDWSNIAPVCFQNGVQPMYHVHPDAPDYFLPTGEPAYIVTYGEYVREYSRTGGYQTNNEYKQDLFTVTFVAMPEDWDFQMDGQNVNEQPSNEKQPDNALVATPTASTVLVNGAPVAFEAYNINDNNYFKLRDIAYILNGTGKQFEVGYDGAANAISLTSGQGYTAVGGEMEGKGSGAKTPVPTDSKILLNGTEISLTAYNIDSNNYFKLRDLGAAINFGVDWDGANNAIVIDTSKGYMADGAVTPPTDSDMSAVLNTYSYSDLAITFEWGEDEHNPGSVGICDLNFTLEGEKADVTKVLIAGWRQSWTDNDIVQTAEIMIPIWKQQLDAMALDFNGKVGAGFPVNADELGTTTDVMLIVLNKNLEAVGHVIVTVAIPASVS